MSAKAVNALVEQILAVVSQAPPPPGQAFEHVCAIHSLLGQLIELQKDRSVVASRCGKTDFAPFEAWLTANGCPPHPKVKIASFGDEGNGLTAMADIERAEHIISVPRNLILSVAGSAGTDVHKLVASDKLLSAAPSTALAMLLLHELHSKDSHWAPYIDILPAVYSTPLYWTVDELRLLSVTSAFPDVVTVFRQVTRQYAYLHLQLRTAAKQKLVSFSDKAFVFDDFRWAMAAVSTRQNQIPVGSASSSAGPPTMGLALIPLWDMMNHEHGEITTMYDVQEARTEYHSVRAYAKGEQVCMFYGARSNSDLLLHSGFVFAGHQTDFMRLRLGVGKGQDSATLKKIQLLKEIGVPSAGNFAINQDGTLEPPTWAFIRINAMSEGEVTKFCENPQSCANLGAAVCPELSKGCEVKACTYLQVRCKLLHAGYAKQATELEPGSSYHMKCASQLALAEAAMLQAVAKGMADRLETLSSK